jgi:hypothetical protein
MITRNIADSGTTTFEIYKPTGGGVYFNNSDNHANNFTAFTVGGTERMRIDSSGNINHYGAKELRLYRSDNAVYSTVFASGNNIYLNSASGGFVELRNNGAAVLTTEDAVVKIGTTGATYSGSKLMVVQTGSGNAVGTFYHTSTSSQATPCLYLKKFDNDSTTSQVFVKFKMAGASDTSQGQINANGASQAAFGSYSDSRLKENIVEIPSQLENIKALRPVEFDYKNGSGHQLGFIAQEVQAIYPDLVGESEGYLTLSGLGKNEARLIKAIQELSAKVDQLTARIVELESR